MIRKYFSFCDQNLRFAATLRKKLKISSLSFSFLIFLFNSYFLFGRGFLAILNLLNSFKSSKRYNGPKL